MTRNELEILKQMCKKWFRTIMEWERDRPQEVYLASQFVKDLDDVVKELEKGILEEH